MLVLCHFGRVRLHEVRPNPQKSWRAHLKGEVVYGHVFVVPG